MAALTDTVGPSIRPLSGVMVNTVGSSTSVVCWSNPFTRMAVPMRHFPPSCTCFTVHRAGTSVGLRSRYKAWQLKRVWQTPKLRRGEEPDRNGVLMDVTTGTRRVWPVGYDASKYEIFSVGLPASVPKVLRRC